MEILMQALLLAVGFVLLVKGADWFVDGASELAARFHIPPLVIGLTVVAMGTSCPEAAVSLSAALKGSADITVGNILGSNILNILLILGITAVLQPLTVERTAIRHELPFLAAVTALFFWQGLDGTIHFGDGALLTLLFVLYLLYLLRSARQTPAPCIEIPKPRKLWQTLFRIAAGLAAIVLGSQLAVDAACTAAGLLGISERFIGLTIVALGTSLPELVTSAAAAKKGNADIAVGNVIGSNIFNLLFVTGVSALVTPVPFAPAFRLDCAVSGGAAVLLLACCARSGRLKRSHGALLLICYAIYFASIL